MLFYVRVKIKIYVLLRLSCLSSSKPVNKCALLTTLRVMVIVYIYFLYNETDIKITVYMRPSSGIGLRDHQVSEWMMEECPSECSASPVRGNWKDFYCINFVKKNRKNDNLWNVIKRKSVWRECSVKIWQRLYIHIHTWTCTVCKIR